MVTQSAGGPTGSPQGLRHCSVPGMYRKEPGNCKQSDGLRLVCCQQCLCSAWWVQSPGSWALAQQKRVLSQPRRCKSEMKGWVGLVPPERCKGDPGPGLCPGGGWTGHLRLMAVSLDLDRTSSCASSLSLLRACLPLSTFPLEIRTLVI